MRLHALFLCIGLLCACGSSDDASGSGGAGATGGGTGATGGGGTGGAATGGDGGKSAACVDRDAKLQAALEQARAKIASRDAALAVVTADCGPATYVSGESGLTGAELFRIGSSTKTYVAALILRLVGAGALSLDDHLDKWVSGVPNGQSITVRMLLNHTSGIFSYTKDPAFLSDPKKKWTPAALIALAASHGPTSAPGAQWEYSNTNYICLGVIAEKVTGKSLAQAIRSELLAPHQLGPTFFDGAEPLGDPLAPGFASDGSDATYVVDPSGAWAAGAMTATPGDTARWIERLGSGAVLGAAEQAKMQEGVPVGSNASYGLGLLMLDTAGTGGAGKALGHGGVIHGYRAMALHFPETHTTIAALVNQDGADVNQLMLAALNTLFP